MKVLAPAKVNLQLSVRGRRPDGYHEIETLIAPVTIHDELNIEIAEGDSVSVSCDDPAVPTDAGNLAAAAFRRFVARTGRRFSAAITIRKRIPAGAGLGGGSSDAAAVLKALDALLETRLGLGELESLAAELGSDVPFFIRGQPARCRGRGEIIEPAPEFPELRLLLVKPPFPVQTPWAYGRWGVAPPVPGALDEAQEAAGLTIVNSLERPVFEKFLLLPALKSWLKSQKGVEASAMSGSGSTVFAILSRGADADNLARAIRTEFGDTLWTAACRTAG